MLAGHPIEQAVNGGMDAGCQGGIQLAYYLLYVELREIVVRHLIHTTPIFLQYRAGEPICELRHLEQFIPVFASDTTHIIVYLSVANMVFDVASYGNLHRVMRVCGTATFYIRPHGVELTEQG